MKFLDSEIVKEEMKVIEALQKKSMEMFSIFLT